MPPSFSTLPLLSVMLVVALLAPAEAATPRVAVETHRVGLPVATVHTGPSRLPLRMVVDTAAGATLVTTATREKLGLGPSAQTIPVQGAAGVIMAGVHSIASVHLGPIEATGVLAVESDLPAELTEVDGILGNNVLEGNRILFDLAGGALERLEAAPAGAGWVRVPFRQVSRIILFEGRLNDSPVTFVLDTGAAVTVANGQAAEALADASADPGAPTRPLQGLGTAAVATRIVADAALSVGSLTLVPGQLKIAELPVFRVLGLADVPSVVLGVDKLRQFLFVIDYPGQALLIEASAKGA